MVTVADLIQHLQIAAASRAEVQVLTDDAVEHITSISTSEDGRTLFILTRRAT